MAYGDESMKLIKSIEAKNLDLKVTTNGKRFYVEENGKKVCESVNLKSVMQYFDIAYNQYLQRNH